MDPGFFNLGLSCNNRNQRWIISIIFTFIFIRFIIKVFVPRNNLDIKNVGGSITASNYIRLTTTISCRVNFFEGDIVVLFNKLFCNLRDNGIMTPDLATVRTVTAPDYYALLFLGSCNLPYTPLNVLFF